MCTQRQLPVPTRTLVESKLTKLQLDMQDGDTLEVHQEQIGGSW
jgi:hypothetical protein